MCVRTTSTRARHVCWVANVVQKNESGGLVDIDLLRAYAVVLRATLFRLRRRSLGRVDRPHEGFHRALSDAGLMYCLVIQYNFVEWHFNCQDDGFPAYSETDFRFRRQGIPVTLCIAWKDDSDVHFASDSRLKLAPNS